MKVLDLFSGIGGFSLGLERAGMETIAFCEIEPFCQKVLRKHWPAIPIHNDIRELDGKQFKKTVDLVCGGFPCQPYSTAGHRRGAADDRALWPAMLRIIQESRPTYVIGENVGGFVKMGLDSLLSDLDGIGYTTGAIVIPACAVGRNQWRKRVWILAHALQGVQPFGRDIGRIRRERQQIPWYGMGEEEATPRMVGNFNGIPNGMDRIRSLGNAVVPQILELIGRAIMAREYETKATHKAR